MISLVFEVLNATLGTLIGQIKSGVEQADKAQKASLALGQSLGGLSKQLTTSDKLQKNFNRVAKDTAARTDRTLDSVRKGTEELSNSLKVTTTKLGKEYRIAGDTFKETVGNLNKGFEEMVRMGIIDRGKPIKEMTVDNLRGDFTQRMGTVLEGLQAGIELDEIDGSIGDLINEQMLLGGDVKGTAKSLAFLNTTMRMDTRQRDNLVEALRDTRDKFTVSIDTLVDSVDAIKQFIPLFKSAGMENAVGGIIKAAGQLGPEMQQQFKDFAQLMFDPSFEAMQKRSILGVQGFTRAIQGLDEAGVQKAFMEAAQQSSRVVDSMAGDLGTMVEGFSVPVNALGNVAFSIKALGEMDPRKIKESVERVDFANQISVLFDEIFAPFDKFVFSELYDQVLSVTKAMKTVLTPVVQGFASKLSMLFRDDKNVADLFINIYNSMAQIANLFISLAESILSNVGSITDSILGMMKFLPGGDKVVSSLKEGFLRRQRQNPEFAADIEKRDELEKALAEYLQTAPGPRFTPKGETYRSSRRTSDETIMVVGGVTGPRSKFEAELSKVKEDIKKKESGWTGNLGTAFIGLAETLEGISIPLIGAESRREITNALLGDIKENTEDPPDFAEPTMLMTESVKSLGDTLLAITLSNYDEERDIALASLKAQVDIATAIDRDIPPGPGATAIAGGAK